MSKVVSEDSVRRSFSKLPEEASIAWLQGSLERVDAPVLSDPWIFDADATIKTAYGELEVAVVGYNLHRPDHPSHTYHTYMVANLRLILEVEVRSGKRVASKHSAPAYGHYCRASIGRR